MLTRITVSLMQYGTLYSEFQNPEPEIWKVFLAEIHEPVKFERHI
jgi:hypothetical protein